MGCCGNSLFDKNKDNRRIKFMCDTNGASLAVLNGANTVSKLSMCDWSVKYTQYHQAQMFLKAGALNVEIPYNIDTQVKFVFIKVLYNNKNAISSFTPFVNNSEVPFLSYIFETTPNEVRYIDDLMILTGTENHKIPKIFLSNPTTTWDAIVTILVATDSVTNESAVINIGDNVTSLENLLWTNVTSSPTLLTITSNTNGILNIRWIDITVCAVMGDIELNNKIITIHDYVRGTINLSFIDEFNANQAFSAIKWALCNVAVNIINNTLVADTTAPTINHTLNYTTDIVLSDFVSATPNVITKQELFDYLYLGATDDRDCVIVFNSDNMKIREINSTNSIDIINQVGKYFIEVNVMDYAKNNALETFMLNIKDLQAPKLVLSNTGLYLVNLEILNNPPLLSLNPNNYIMIDDNLIDTFIEFITVTDNVAYLIFDNIVIEIAVTNSLVSPIFVFDNDNFIQQLSWSVTDINLVLPITINTIDYEITYINTNTIKIHKV